MAIDPICKMQVDERTALRGERDGEKGAPEKPRTEKPGAGDTPPAQAEGEASQGQPRKRRRRRRRRRPGGGGDSKPREDS